MIRHMESTRLVEDYDRTYGEYSNDLDLADLCEMDAPSS